MQSLKNNPDVIFDEESYEGIATKAEANSAQDYYSKNVAKFRTELSHLGWDYEEIEEMVELLWKQVINGCIRTGAKMNSATLAYAKGFKMA